MIGPAPVRARRGGGVSRRAWDGCLEAAAWRFLTSPPCECKHRLHGLTTRA